jgi:putative nucleotidyltransferase with HDIG domain
MDKPLSLLEMIEAAVEDGEISLPARNQTARRLQAIIADEDHDIEQVLELIESDQALTTEVLRVANSPFYGGLSEVTTVRKAVVRIGGPEIVRLAIAATEKRSYQVADRSLATTIASLWDHALGTALGARWLARKLGFGELESEAFIAGLLHDVGKLLLIRIVDQLKTEGRLGDGVPETVLAEVLESGHTRHGAVLLEHWGLPEAYRRVVRDHHTDPVDASDTLLLLVRLANLACHGLGIGMVCDPSVNLAATEEAYALDARDILLAELSIMLEDAFGRAPEPASRT